jgi:glycine cleavage system H protein
LSGTIQSVNKELQDKPELVNTDPYGEGWIFKMQIEDISELEMLLDSAQYNALMPEDEG